MALSMFIRNSACTSRVLSQQMRWLSQQSLKQCTVASSLPVRSLTLKEADAAPILTSVRKFATSPALLSAEKSHDHSRLWVMEKATSALLVPLIPLGLMMPNKIIDCTLAVLICAHSFWGLEAIAVDYARPSVVGAVLAKASLALVYVICIATLGGLFYLIGHDVGLCNAIKQFWAVKAQQKA